MGKEVGNVRTKFREKFIGDVLVQEKYTPMVYFYVEDNGRRRDGLIRNTLSSNFDREFVRNSKPTDTPRTYYPK